jgi:hypothetical protein
VSRRSTKQRRAACYRRLVEKYSKGGRLTGLTLAMLAAHDRREARRVLSVFESRDWARSSVSDELIAPWVHKGQTFWFRTPRWLP